MKTAPKRPSACEKLAEFKTNLKIGSQIGAAGTKMDLRYDLTIFQAHFLCLIRKFVHNFLCGSRFPLGQGGMGANVRLE